MNLLTENNKNQILDRLNYYNKLEEVQNLPKESKKLSEININEDSKTYFFDFREYHRYFNQKLRVKYTFGDITEVQDFPTFVKSRPINNSNSILLKWDKVRHFTFVKKDSKKFSNKKNQLVFRGKVHPTQPHRIKFMEMYKTHSI
ncbi:hypothetical protein [Psychroflexus lacisalsi]|uniref:Uncharacterized protein n=1 Tax=Psychroflexus lacisalsi TaxID=503928 RepID=A0ABP3VIH3_9FLAO|nr:hypothetical protein [Psychroflexus lacisalsi]MBZ9619696.1 hypothetical protein [Psychroflexus lacisalsi]